MNLPLVGAICHDSLDALANVYNVLPNDTYSDTCVYVMLYLALCVILCPWRVCLSNYAGCLLVGFCRYNK